MSGWFSLRRGMFDHPIFAKRPERVAVWVWMIATAAWKDTRMDAGGKVVTVRRGQLLTSYRQISDATGVGVQVIRTLLDQLRGERAIDTETNTGRLLVTICNYDKYQTGGGSGNTDTNTPVTHGQHTKEQENKYYTLEPIGSNGADAPQPIEVSVTSSAVWNAGKPFLASRGVDNPGAMIGRWLKDHSPLALLQAIEAAQKSGTQDPVPYITEALKGKTDARRARSTSADRIARVAARFSDS